MPQQSKASDFDRDFVPHLQAAYNLARWLVRDDHDAQDVVQEAYLRALRYLDGFRGGDPRVWLLKIVRNTAYSWLKRNRASDPPAKFDENEHADTGATVEAELLRRADAQMLKSALAALPAEFREVVVMRDVEGLSYKEIAAAAEIPVGTVMSRLARARRRLARALATRREN